MTQRQIENVIETTLIEKKINNQNYIRYSFYEINVKYPKEYGIEKPLTSEKDGKHLTLKRSPKYFEYKN